MLPRVIQSFATLVLLCHIEAITARNKSSTHRLLVASPCVNWKSECESWRSTGQCVTDSVRMENECPRACGLCERGAGGGVKNQWTFVVNTPKSGTGTLQQSFVASSECLDSKTFAMRGVYADVCSHETNVVLRSHHIGSAEGFLQFLQRVAPASTARCLVVTNIRDPRTWLPSLFFERNKEDLCKPNQVSAATVVGDYRRWLLSPQFSPVSYVAPDVLKLFEGGQNFTAVLGQLFGSSLARTKTSSKTIGQPDSAGLSGAALHLRAIPGSPWAHSRCELVAMRVEDSDHWPAELAAASPGFRLYSSQGTSKRCAGEGDAIYAALKAYVLTTQEVGTILRKDSTGGFREAWSFYEQHG